MPLKLIKLVYLQVSFKIVGPDEIYKGENDCISIDSPMARALIKKEEGDGVLVSAPSGPVEFTSRLHDLVEPAQT